MIFYKVSIVYQRNVDDSKFTIRRSALTMFRSFTALLILANYLWLAGGGFISRPDESPYVVKIETSSGQQHHYEESRYVRMESLEAFVNEVLATKYRDDTEGNLSHSVSVTLAVDCHVFPQYLYVETGYHIPHLSVPEFKVEPPLPDVYFAIFSPPRLSLTV